MTYKTLGVVLKRQNFAEADRILTIFTERFGKIKAIAKGVRKISAKLAGSLEPFMLIELQLHEGRNFFTVTGAVIKSDYASLHSDLKKMASAFYAGELIDKFESEHQKSGRVFKLLVKMLIGVDLKEPKSALGLDLCLFAILLLKESGFWGDLSNCLHCKEKLRPEENYWDGEEGGVICGQCQKLYHHGRPISNDLIKLFRLMEKGDFGLAERLSLEPELEKEAETILAFYLKDVLESDIKSERFLRNVN